MTQNNHIPGLGECIYNESLIDINYMRHYEEDRQKFLEGNYSIEDLNSFIDGYLDKNAAYSVVHYKEVPLTEDELMHIRDIMRSLYYNKAGKHRGGAFVEALLKDSGQSIALADNTCLRALKLFMWFIRNELSGVRDLTAESSISN